MWLDQDKKGSSKANKIGLYFVHGICDKLYQELVEASSGCVFFMLCQQLHHGKHCVLPSFRLYKGLMLRDDDAHKRFELQILGHIGGLNLYGLGWNHY